MHFSRRAAIVGAAVLIALVSLGAAGAAGAALASPTAPAAHARVQVLRLHTVDASDALNGSGNVFAVVYDLQTPAGAEAGKAYLSCTQATASVNLCHAAYVLHGGQIDVQVAVLPSTTNETLAVTGGTGVYAGVTGWARSVGADRTFHLIRPGQN